MTSWHGSAARPCGGQVRVARAEPLARRPGPVDRRVESKPAAADRAGLLCHAGAGSIIKGASRSTLCAAAQMFGNGREFHGRQTPCQVTVQRFFAGHRLIAVPEIDQGKRTSCRPTRLLWRSSTIGQVLMDLRIGRRNENANDAARSPPNQRTSLHSISVSTQVVHPIDVRRLHPSGSSISTRIDDVVDSRYSGLNLNQGPNLWKVRCPPLHH